MRLGLIARCDDRGLGAQTRRFYEAMRPDVTVVVRNLAHPGWAQHDDWYPDGLFTDWRGYHNPVSDDALEALLACDVVYTAETYYDERLPFLAAGRTRLVLHVNPEFWRPGRHDVLWVPTPWRRQLIPGAELVEVPCPPFEDVSGDRLVHVAGHRAAGDRNGSHAAWWAAHNSNREWKLCGQDGRPPPGPHRNRVQVFGPQTDWRDLYRDGGLLVYPRRYGGLALPVLEAMSCGLAVAMPEVPPNLMWPIIPLRWHKAAEVKTVAGPIPTVMVDPRWLAGWANSIDWAAAQDDARRWSRTHSWDVAAADYRRRLEALV